MSTDGDSGDRPLLTGFTGLPGGFSATLRIATVLVDSDDHVIHLDKVAEEFTGFRSAEIVGRDVHTLTGPGESLVDCRDGTDGTEGVVSLRRADGSSRVVMTRTQVVPLPQGNWARLVQLVDVAETHDRSTQLGLLDAYFHQSPIGFLVLDERLRYVMVNQSLADFNDRPIADHVGRHIREVLASPDIDAYENLLREVLATGEPAVDVSIARTSTARLDSRKVASASWFRIVNRFGLPLGLCGMVHDVTAERHQLLADARDRERTQLLGAVGAIVGASLDLEKVAGDLTELLIAGFCDLTVIDVLGDIVAGEPVDDSHDRNAGPYRLAGATRIADPGIQRLVGERGARPLTASPGLDRVLSDHRAGLYRSHEEILKNAPVGMRAAIVAQRLSSVILVPLRARGGTFGALTCARFGDQTAFDDDDLGLAREIGSRAALALDNARLYREERRTALVLQLGLLPDRLPAVPEAAFECRYVPGHTGRHAGGDWYDVISLPGRRIAMVIGDVAGHGLAAAAAMGRYRSVVHALASVGLAPGALLTRLNEIATTFDEHALATCLYVYYDPWEHQCGIASAGHPPVILGVPDEPARPLALAPGPMLGASPNTLYESVAVEAPPGTRLLLYSDGLIESRRAPIEAGIAELAHRMGSRRPPLPQQADHLLGAAPADSRDDQTLLLAELRGLPRDAAADDGPVRPAASGPR